MWIVKQHWDAGPCCLSGGLLSLWMRLRFTDFVWTRRHHRHRHHHHHHHQSVGWLEFNGTFIIIVIIVIIIVVVVIIIIEAGGSRQLARVPESIMQSRSASRRPSLVVWSVWTSPANRLRSPPSIYRDLLMHAPLAEPRPPTSRRRDVPVPSHNP